MVEKLETMNGETESTRSVKETKYSIIACPLVSLEYEE